MPLLKIAYCGFLLACFQFSKDWTARSPGLPDDKIFGSFGGGEKVLRVFSCFFFFLSIIFLMLLVFIFMNSVPLSFQNAKRREVHIKELEHSLQKSENQNQSIHNYVQFLKNTYVTMFGWASLFLSKSKGCMLGPHWYIFLGWGGTTTKNLCCLQCRFYGKFLA